MTATTIPEQIVPSSLLAYTGDDFTSVVAGGMPNGDDFLQVGSAAGSDRQKAFQIRRTDSHLLRVSPNLNALSFWIRRRQNFALPNASMGAGSTTGTTAARSQVMFGVGNPLATAGQLTPTFGSLAWAVHAYGVGQIQFFILGRANNAAAWYPGPPILLGLDEWTFVVVNLAPYTNTNTPLARGGMSTTVNGTALPEWNVAAANNYFYWPENVVNYDMARFAIGDPTSAQLATQGVDTTGAVPLYDIGKLTMHNQNLSMGEQLSLIESMRYGP